MTQRQNYASKLTKQDLMNSGITLITEDGYVFKGEKQVIPSINKQGYLMISIYDLDENGNKIKIPVTRKFKGCSKLTDTYVYKFRTVGLHRAMWAWTYGVVDDGYVVDHKSNKHESIEDYTLDNLQLLTPAENLAKERGESNKQLKCKLNKPLSFYENKLNMYLEQYEQAKKDHNADLCHKLRANVANMKAKIRYYKDNIDEAEAFANENKAKLAMADEKRKRANDIKLLNAYAKIFKSNGNLNKWHETCRFIRYYDTYDSELINKFIECIKKEADKAYEKN